MSCDVCVCWLVGASFHPKFLSIRFAVEFFAHHLNLDVWNPTQKCNRIDSRFVCFNVKMYEYWVYIQSRPFNLCSDLSLSHIIIIVNRIDINWSSKFSILMWQFQCHSIDFSNAKQTKCVRSSKIKRIESHSTWQKNYAAKRNVTNRMRDFRF